MNGRKNVLRSCAGAVLLVASFGTMQAGLVAQQPAAAPAARPKLAPPVKGVAEMAYTQPVTKNDGKFLTTTLRVKNMAAGSIAGFKLDYILYDKGNNPVTGDTFRYRRPMQPGEVVDITLKAPVNKAAVRDAYNFTHANGEIKPKLQKTIS